MAGSAALGRGPLRPRPRGTPSHTPATTCRALDVARKALILARELGLPLELDDVAVEPFVDASLLAEDDPERFLLSLASHDETFGLHVARYAAAGRTLRYLVQIVPGAEGRRSGRPRGGGAGHPAVPLRGAEALVAFTTARYRDYPLIVRGAGAGGDVTAVGVLAEVSASPRTSGAADSPSLRSPTGGPRVSPHRPRFPAPLLAVVRRAPSRGPGRLRQLQPEQPGAEEVRLARGGARSGGSRGSHGSSAPAATRPTNSWPARSARPGSTAGAAALLARTNGVPLEDRLRVQQARVDRAGGPEGFAGEERGRAEGEADSRPLAERTPSSSSCGPCKRTG